VDACLQQAVIIVIGGQQRPVLPWLGRLSHFLVTFWMVSAGGWDERFALRMLSSTACELGPLFNW